MILMAKLHEMRGHWEHFSRHFAAKLEKGNLWLRPDQTLLFMVSRGWVWKCRATFFKWSSEVDPGDVILRLLVKFRVQPGTQMVTFGHNFRYKLKVYFLMIFRRARLNRRARKMAHRRGRLKLLS